MIQDIEELTRHINTLPDKNRHLPLLVHDEQDKWYSISHIELKLRPATEDSPPNTYHEMHIRRYHTSKETKYTLKHETPIREIYHLLDETLNNIREGDADLMDGYNAIHDALHKLCEYDDVYTHELTPTQRKTYRPLSSELIDPLDN